jgi:hypothetical protein
VADFGRKVDHVKPLFFKFSICGPVARQPTVRLRSWANEVILCLDGLRCTFVKNEERSAVMSAISLTSTILSRDNDV